LVENEAIIMRYAVCGGKAEAEKNCNPWEARATTAPE